MSDNLPYCRIQGNADIAGIGIRASLYIQACIGPLFFLFLLMEGAISGEKFIKQEDTNARKLALKRCKLLDEIGLGLLLTGAALITSTVIEAKTTDSGLSPYHTLIVLNLCWLNNVTGFNLRLWSFFVKCNSFDFTIFFRTSWVFMLHSLIMSIVGIWFWADPNSFSRISHDQPCIPMTYFWLFSRIPLPNDRLRIFSLIAYSAISIPTINIIIHIFPWILVFPVDETIFENWFFGPWSFLFQTVVMGPTVFYITSTEMLIAANAEFVDHDVEEKWTFGQTLAIFLAAVSVFLVLGHIREQRREARKEARKEVWKAKMDESGIGISRAARGIAAMMLATQGRIYRARDVGPKILSPDEESLGFSW